MSTIEIKAYEILKSKWGEKEAETLIEYFRSVSKEEVKNLTTKEETQKSESGLKEDIRRLDVKISETKNDIIKWLFGFWITIVVLLVANFFLK